MKTRIPTLILGLILLLAGAYALLNQFCYLEDLSPQIAIVVFAVLSVLFFVAYFLSGIQSWGWLFPACTFAALAGTMAIIEANITEEWIATLIVGSVAVPFLAAFFLDRSRWWALIPGFILSVIAVIPALTPGTADEWIGVLVVAAIGLPFIVVYLVAPKHWWAIIPGGVMISIALLILLSEVQITRGDELGVVVMFLGWALTFGIVWFRRNLHGTDWAKYPALALAGVALIIALTTSGWDFIWAVALILGGLAMVLYSLMRRRKSEI